LAPSAKNSEQPSIEQRDPKGLDIKKSHTDKVRTTKDKELKDKDKDAAKTQPLNFY